jgi:SAM-dependent methyltransferase
VAHEEQINFCKKVKNSFPEYFKNVNVLDVGSLDINGSNRYLFEDYEYTGIDVGEGKNVDVVCRGHEFKSSILFDTIISTEVFEHDVHYVKTIKNIISLLKPNGLFLFTCASIGRPEHGTFRTTIQDNPLAHGEFGEYYKNLEESDIRKIVNIEKIFAEFTFEYQDPPCDLYFYGIKKKWERSRNKTMYRK